MRGKAEYKSLTFERFLSYELTGQNLGSHSLSYRSWALPQFKYVEMIWSFGCSAFQTLTVNLNTTKEDEEDEEEEDQEN